MSDLNTSSIPDLSRKEYWEQFYAKELENFEEYGDEGDVWFGTKNVERIVNWIMKHNIEQGSPILDVGCGNGMTLIILGKKGFTDLTGIDYAEEAVELAEKVAKNNNIDLKFRVLDFLKDDMSIKNLKEFDVVIDKGTYDAICLSPDDTELKRKQYVNRINQLLRLTGYFIITSCNWTKEELLSHFTGFSLYDEIEIPKIGFGGQTGQTVTSIILKKNGDITDT